MEFKRRTLSQLADMVCGNADQGETALFRYRSSSRITEFFQDCDTEYMHDGSTRAAWVADTLREILAEPQPTASHIPAPRSSSDGSGSSHR
jgi:hypothetical protein